ncbi:MAG: dockerin type I domain-containing protein, partial [Microgenomates group bacterium]
QPTNTPTPTPTQTPTPTPNPNCTCLSEGFCGNNCPVNDQSNYWEGALAANISYTRPMRCGLNNNNIYINNPTNDQINQFCQRNLRPKGDVDGDGKINFLTDYLYYVQAFSGGKIAANINLDVNGNGEVTPDDGTIIRANIQQ